MDILQKRVGHWNDRSRSADQRCDSPSKESKEIERTKGEVRKKQKTKD